MKVANDQAPMTLDEVQKLKPVQAAGEEKGFASETPFAADFETETIDGRVYPKGGEAVGFKAGEKAFGGAEEKAEPYLPSKVGVAYLPKAEPRNLRKPKFIDRDQLAALQGVKTIFSPDERKVYYSTVYPWRCVGRVETSLGIGSGVMIGPRHLLTCSHIIDWKPNNTTGWLKFSPMYYNGSTPFGTAWAIKTYYKFKVAGPTIDATEAQYDYTVVVLDRRTGDTTGWMGAKSYTDAWDGRPYWTHAGYPADLTGTQRPTYQTGIALDGDFWTTDAHERIDHRGDVWPGQSGGPFWAYWDGQPYAVATQSGQNPTYNTASGGSDLVDLVLKARADYP